MRCSLMLGERRDLFAAEIMKFKAPAVISIYCKNYEHKADYVNGKEANSTGRF